MMIQRTYEEMENLPRYGGVYDIELTPEEIQKAYWLQWREFHICDMAQDIADRIEDNGLDKNFAEDWPMRVGFHNINAFIRMMDGNDYFNEVYNNMVHDFVTTVLKKLGYDPATMKKKEDNDD